MKKIIFSIAMIILLLFLGCKGADNSEEEISYISIDDLIAEQQEATDAEVTEAGTENVVEEVPEEVVIEEATETPEEEVTVVLEEDVIEETAEAATEIEIPVKEVTEGELISFPNLQATDPDGDPLVYTFSQPLNDKGEWQTAQGDAGDYKVTITVSDGKSEVSQDIRLRVKALNLPPVLSGVEDVINVKEGDTIELKPIVSDPDGDEVSVQYTGYMTSSRKVTNFNDAGEKFVTIIVSDGKEQIEKQIRIMIENVNRPPRLEPINKILVIEGENVIVGVKTSDPDGDTVGITFDAPLAQDGTWQTAVGDAGEYNIKVTASDGSLEDTKFAKVTVQSANKPPVLEVAPTITVKEGETVRLNPTATDPEGDEVEITISGWMSGSEKTTGYDDAGKYIVTVTASDGKSEVKKDVQVTVENVNRPPKFVGII